MVIPKKYGWKPGLPRKRHHNLSVFGVDALPTSCDLRPKMPPVYNQGELGSCTANSAAGALEYLIGKQGATEYVPSRLFIYYNERLLTNQVSVDSGGSIYDVVDSVKQYGACPETLWPYNTNEFTVKPTDASYSSALSSFKFADEFYLNKDEIALKTSLAAGFPVMFGFTVFDSFESPAVAQTGLVPFPSDSDNIVGGHAVLLVGYENTANDVNWIIRNSWGENWGINGYFIMNNEYMFSELTSEHTAVHTLIK